MHEGRKGRKKSSTKVIKRRQHTSFGILGLSNFILLLELFSWVTCCLARVFQVENSPFLQGTSSAILERFIHYHSKEICREISIICIQFPLAVRISRGCSRGSTVAITAFFQRGLLTREIRIRRFNRFVGYWVSLRAGSGSNIQGSFCRLYG